MLMMCDSYLTSLRLLYSQQVKATRRGIQLNRPTNLAKQQLVEVRYVVFEDYFIHSTPNTDIDASFA
jgi:hypothetical protein